MINEALIQELRTRMLQGLVTFTYRKKNGQVRKAVGTLTQKYIEDWVRPEDVEDYVQPCMYFDVEQDWWRSFKPENLLSIE